MCHFWLNYFLFGWSYLFFFFTFFWTFFSLFFDMSTFFLNLLCICSLHELTVKLIQKSLQPYKRYFWSHLSEVQFFFTACTGDGDNGIKKKILFVCIFCSNFCWNITKHTSQWNNSTEWRKKKKKEIYNENYTLIYNRRSYTKNNNVKCAISLPPPPSNL